MRRFIPVIVLALAIACFAAPPLFQPPDDDSASRPATMPSTTQPRTIDEVMAENARLKLVIDSLQSRLALDEKIISHIKNAGKPIDKQPWTHFKIGMTETDVNSAVADAVSALNSLPATDISRGKDRAEIDGLHESVEVSRKVIVDHANVKCVEYWMRFRARNGDLIQTGPVLLVRLFFIDGKISEIQNAAVEGDPGTIRQ